MRTRLPHYIIGALLGAMMMVSAAAAGERPLRIVALNTVIAEIAREVGGNQVAVDNLVPPGVDPHTFDPSGADLRAMVDADVVLASGLQLESYLDRVVTKLGLSGRVIFVGDQSAKGLAALTLPSGEKDPHWWNSIRATVVATDTIGRELVRLRPAEAAAFKSRASAYANRLVALGEWVKKKIETLPPAQRQLVTSHDAFGYFARDYGFTVHAIAGLSTDGEPDARELARLIDLIRREHIRAVFAESSVNSSLVTNLVAETGVRLGGTLYADGLGTADSDAATYEAMMRHNVRTMVDALK